MTEEMDRSEKSSKSSAHEAEIKGKNKVSRRSFLTTVAAGAAGLLGMQLLSGCESVTLPNGETLVPPTNPVPTPTFGALPTETPLPRATPTPEILVTPDSSTSFDEVVYRGEGGGPGRIAAPLFPSEIFGNPEASHFADVRFLNLNALSLEGLPVDEQRFIEEMKINLISWLEENGKVGGSLSIMRMETTGMSENFRRKRGYMPFYIDAQGSAFAFFSTDGTMTFPIGWFRDYFPWQLGFAQPDPNNPDREAVGLLLPGATESERSLLPLIEKRGESFYFVSPWGTGEFELQGGQDEVEARKILAIAPVTLNNEQFSAKTDDELKSMAPRPNLERLRFRPDTDLRPDIVIRGGEHANYVLYRNQRSHNIELAWNVETGMLEHTAYGEPKTYNIEVDGQMVEVKSVAALFITANRVLAEESGWFGADSNPQFFNSDPAVNAPGLETPELRAGEAITQGLATWNWFERLHPETESFRSTGTMPSLAEIPPLDNGNFIPSQYVGARNSYLAAELTCGQRGLLADYWRNLFLQELYRKKSTGQSFEITFKATGENTINLAVDNPVIIMRFDRTQEHLQTSNHWHDFTAQLTGANTLHTLNFIFGQRSTNSITLTIDWPAYRTERNRLAFFGGFVTVLTRALMGYDGFFADFISESSNPDILSYDFTYGIANAFCPRWSLPQISDLNYNIPVYNIDLTYATADADRCAIQWVNG